VLPKPWRHDGGSNFDHLSNPEGHPDQGIGPFFRFGASDGVANSIKYAFSAGISGKGIVPGWPRDTVGFGWARTQFGNNFVPVLRERLDIGRQGGRVRDVLERLAHPLAHRHARSSGHRSGDQ
jgi:Carbohydrate-selective porin, OprB family